MPEISLSSQTVVNASVEQCWQVLGEEFGEIANWAASIKASSYTSADSQTRIGGTRTCEIPGFGNLREKVTAWDNGRHRFEYEIAGMPRMIQHAVNSWSVQPRSDGSSEVTTVMNIQLTPILGGLMSPLLKGKLRKGMKRLLEEFEHYVRTGERHPRTARAIAK